MEIKRLMETKTQKVINWKAFTMKRVVLWFIVSLAISFIFFQEFWASLGAMLSLDWIFSQHHAASWGILALCKIWLWFKRKDIWEKMQLRPGLFFIPLGLALVAGAVLMPSSQNYLVFQVLLASLGVFIILFGKAARFPSILLGIYGFAISIPVIIERFAELPYSMSAIKPVVWILTSLGYPLGNEGQMVHLTTSAGEPISVAITAACAGPATMGVFLAIFALMMLDTTLRPRKAAWLFVFGVVGTWLQSVIRLIILMLVGHYWGEAAMWTAHAWTIYILFPLWYLLFAYIYFRQAGSLSRIREEARAQLGQAITAWKATAVAKDNIMKKVTRIAVIFILLALVPMLIMLPSGVGASPDTTPLDPTGNVAVALDVEPITSANWEVVSDVSDATYVETTNASFTDDLYSLADVSSSAGVINNVTIKFTAIAAFSGTAGARSLMRINTTDYYGDANVISTTITPCEQIYTSNPFTTKKWTWADVNALQVGVSLIRSQKSTPKWTRCTKLWVEVNYTPTTWASYKTGYGVEACDVFQEFATENTVYMEGTGFIDGESYKVIYWYYYDTTWYKRFTDTGVVAASGSILQNSYTFVLGDQEGNWQATVYYPDTYNPTSYSATDLNLVANDTSYNSLYSFYVYASAIPEFSTVMAAIGVAGLCFGIYFWMRKRAKFKMQGAK